MTLHCRHPAHRHSIFCIVPPYLLDRIAQHGSPVQRAKAVLTRSYDGSFRTLRVASAPARFALAQRGLAAPAAAFSAQRSIYSANGTETLPGTLVRSEGHKASGDVAVDEAYDGLGATFDFFAKVFERNSIDNAGMPLQATVHFGQDYDNAFWNSQQMVFGDGDGELFNRFTASLDVIGHELVHGVTESESQLEYFNQSGALNESMSDVFGSLIKQFVRDQTAEQADWLIGEGLFTAKVKGDALRSMKDPGSAYDDPMLGKDPQPKHMKDFIQTMEDNGGVHLNSGIPNHAFYQVAIAIGGKAWEKAGRIWYDSLRDSRITSDIEFQPFAQITLDIAGKLFGVGKAEQVAVKQGWAAVGIDL